jgi:hypothetical protein
MLFRCLAACLLAAVFIPQTSALAQKADLSFLPTRAEATDYIETTRYDEAIGFLEVVAATSDDIHLTTFGYSAEGRALPLAVFGRVRGADAQSVLATNRVRVFIQANIHAGEVEGKEATLMLLRSMAMGNYDYLLDSLVVLVAPFYNADGNERVSLYNRPRQHGPIGGMGTRANAQGYDLNRDHMKLDTPETRSIVRLLTDYDPHVLIDLHSTNGTIHAYHLTYSHPLHPATPEPIIEFLRETWLPELSRRMETDGYKTFYYGNLPWPGMDAPRGWYTFDYRPRFGTNYAGLRNRFSILSEAYAYLTFRERIEVTRSLVDHSLNFAARNASVLREIVEAADAPATGQSLPMRAEFQPSDQPVRILMGEVAHEVHPFTGETIYRRVDSVRVEYMTKYGLFAATYEEVVPEAYLIPAEASKALEILRAHGIRVEAVRDEQDLVVERFRISELHRAERAFQQHYERRAEGEYVSQTMTVGPGWYSLDTTQPLGRLASLLLEPMASDGLLNWNAFDEMLDDLPAEARYYPVLRIPVQSH